MAQNTLRSSEQEEGEPTTTATLYELLRIYGIGTSFTHPGKGQFVQIREEVFRDLMTMHERTPEEMIQRIKEIIRGQCSGEIRSYDLIRELIIKSEIRRQLREVCSK